MALRRVISDIDSLVLELAAYFERKKKGYGIFSKMPGYLDDTFDSVRRIVYNAAEYENDYEAEKVKCQHKWRDFDWYLEYSTNGESLTFSIIEPYLCIHCGERKNICLDRARVKYDDGDTEESVLEGLQKMYPKLRPKAVVEDEVHDAMLVDREYLRIADYLRGESEMGHEIELKMGGRTNEL